MPITRYPLQESWSTNLTQDLDGSSLVISVAATPNFTFPAGVTTIATINPKKSTREDVEIESYDAVAKTITIKSGGRNLSQGNGVTTAPQEHASGSTIIISNPYQFLKDVVDGVNNAADLAANNTWSGTNTFTNDVSFTGATTDMKVPVKTTAERTATGSQGDITYDSDDGNFYMYKSAWEVIDTGTPVSNASETSSGKVELATLAEQGSQATSGSAGPLVMQSKNTIKAPATYTPALLTGGTNATSVIGTWNAVTDGSVRITIDGTQRDVSGLDFNADADMDAVAATIQAGIRAATSSTETVVWSTNKFIVSSVNTTATSAITVASSAGVGTDISGAGATNFMDCDTGNGTVTDKVLNQAADENKVPVLNSSGKVNSSMLDIGDLGGITATAAEVNQVCDGVGGTVTTANLDTLTNGSDASALHFHPGSSSVAYGSASRAGTSGSGDQVIAHGLSGTPTLVKVTAYWNYGASNDNIWSNSTGTSNFTTHSCAWVASRLDGQTPGASNGTASRIIYIRDQLNSGIQQATVTADGTNLTFTWTKSGFVQSPNIVFTWEAII